MIKNQVNDSIVGHARRGERAETTTGNMSTEPGRMYYTGYLPNKLVQAFASVRDEINQVIYSYSTPIAVLVRGVWIIPNVTYSATTSSKHQTHLYQLGGRSVPWDCSPEELQRVIDGYMVFTHNGTKPGPDWYEGC